jgi:hypothetical protein
MNKEDIIKMAREAQLVYGSDENPLGSVIRFAALVAEHEREACAKLFDGEVWAYDYREIAVAIRARGEQ